MSVVNVLCLTRDVTLEECYWLPRSLFEGELVFEATDPYGCCTENGRPVRLEQDPDSCYYEVPRDAF